MGTIVDLAREKYNPHWTESEEQEWLDAIAWCEAQELAWRDSLPQYSINQWLEICPEVIDMVPDKLQELDNAKREAIYHFGLMVGTLRRNNVDPANRAFAIESDRDQLHATLADLDKQRYRWLSYLPQKDYAKKTGRLTDDDIARAQAVPLQLLADVTPKKVGSKLIALCPFHVEKTASFYIYLEQNSWWCYGCNQGGSVIDYVMKARDLPFPLAVNWLLERG